MANHPNAPRPDGPPPYTLYGVAEFEAWRVSEHPESVQLDVWLWISGLCWDPWQDPSEQSAAPMPGQDEVRTAVVPDTRVGISYAVAPKAKVISLIAVADLP